MFASTFAEIAAILALAAAFGALGLLLRQPQIIMFLAAGIAAGPSGLRIVASHPQIELLAQIGIALLLFIVGLRLDLELIRTTGPVALATGLGQIVFTSIIGWGIALGLGMEPLPAAYVAVALTFSSTIIIVKLLSDKKEIDSLHGRIAVGFLIVQDIAAVLALVGLTTIGSPLSADLPPAAAALRVLAAGVGLLAFTGLAMRFLLPPLLRRLSASPELLNVFAVAWAVFLGAASDTLHFTKEVGAFLAGVSLASTPFRDAIGARLTGVRDFLLLFFFIDLGARLDWSTVGAQLGGALIFSVFVLAGNPLIVLAIMGAMGYRRRTGFLAGLTVAQISEFSLIVAAAGLQLGHIQAETMGLITLVGVVTIFASTYMILYSEPLYRLLSGPLRVFERRHPYRESPAGQAGPARGVDVILFGAGTYGRAVAEHLLARGNRLLVVDFDPRAIEAMQEKEAAVLYGDLGDPELLEGLPLEEARWIVSTVRSRELNLALVDFLTRRGFPGRIALTAAGPEEARRYEEAGAHVVFRPFVDAAEQAADALTHAMEVFPRGIDWPIGFREIRLRSGSLFAGRPVREVPLRAETGTSILAVSRAGRVIYDPDPGFRLFPGDRLVVVGPPGGLRAAEELLGRAEAASPPPEEGEFVVEEIPIPCDSDLVGRSFAEIRFRQRYAVTVVGIRRGARKILFPAAAERIEAEDRLVVLGRREAIARLRRECPRGAR